MSFFKIILNSAWHSVLREPARYFYRIMRLVWLLQRMKVLKIAMIRKIITFMWRIISTGEQYRRMVEKNCQKKIQKFKIFQRRRNVRTYSSHEDTIMAPVLNQVKRNHFFRGGIAPETALDC